MGNTMNKNKVKLKKVVKKAEMEEIIKRKLDICPIGCRLYTKYLKFIKPVLNPEVDL